MKKTAIIVVVLVLVLVTAAGADWVTKQLVSGATGTTTGAATPLGGGFSSFGVDINSAATCTVTVRIDGNAANDGLFSTDGLATATTCTAAKCYTAITGKPVRQVRGVVTAATGTCSTSVYVTGISQ